MICGPQRQLLDLNEIVGEMIALLPGEHSLKKITEKAVAANLQTGRTAPIPVNPMVWKRMENVRIPLKHS